MRFSLEKLTSGATILGTAVSIVALVHPGGWVIAASLVFACLSVVAFLYARQQRRSLGSASTVIEGHSIDSLNAANLRRRVNRDFFIQEVHHKVRIEGEDMEIAWTYSGYAKRDKVAAFDFSVDADAGTPFDKLNCVGFDLGRDPKLLHAIRPVLTSVEGVSKKISVPFLEPLRVQQSFRILLTCLLPRAAGWSFGYYTSTLSFAQDRVRRCTVELEFAGASPQSVRVYGSRSGKPATLLRNLPLEHRDENLSLYLDVVEEAEGQSSRVYVFRRDEV